MEEISKENATISKPMAKEKKPRSQKQMDAFRLCAERRKQKLLEKKQNVMPQLHPAQKEREQNMSDQVYKNLAEQLEMLKNQVVDLKQEKEKAKACIRMNTNAPVHLPMIEEEPMDIEPQQPQHQPQHQPQYRKPQQNQFQFQKREDMFGQGIGYAVNNSQYQIESRKRDVRGMDPYIDEKQGMMERIYTRSVNNDRQRQMEESQRYSKVDGDSIQLLPATNGNSMNRVDVDRYAPIENMKTMIRSTQYTSNSRKQNAVAFNGYRVASRFR
jgi:hypothetical protein